MTNENVAMQIKLCLAAVLGTLTVLWGWFGWLVLVWAVLMLMDWLIGSAVAAKDGKWSSARLREGAWHKGGMVLIVCVVLVADWLIGTLLANLPMVVRCTPGPAGHCLVRGWRAGQSGGARHHHGRAVSRVASENSGGREGRSGQSWRGADRLS